MRAPHVVARAAVVTLTLLVTGCAASRVAPAGATPGALPRGRPPSPAVNALRADLARIFGAPIMARGVWAVDVRSLDNGEQIFELNAGKLMMPASNMKIVTLATAAEVLGWDYRFTTTLETAAPIDNGVLLGDLFIRGTGDPTINWRDNRADAVINGWAAALRAAGISRIEGRIIGDDQAFDDDWLGAGWSWDYLQYGYAAPVGALQFNESAARLTVTPGLAVGEPAVVAFPTGTGLTLLNRAVTLPEDSAETIEYRRHLDRRVLEVTGGVPIGSGPLTRTAVRTVAVVNPTVFFVASVRQALIGLGIEVAGETPDIDDIGRPESLHSSESPPPSGRHVAQPFRAAQQSRPLSGGRTGAESPTERRVLATTHSPTLREIGTVLMKVSQNLYAETLVKTMGAARGGVGTTAGGRMRMEEVLLAWGIPPDAYVIADGSGLSRYNYVSAAMITTILERMHTDPRHRHAFGDTLPIAGKDGTIGTRMRRSRAEGNVMAKTGSIANVRSLSGYVETRDGETLVFSILANDFPIPAPTVTWIADLAVETLANFARR